MSKVIGSIAILGSGETSPNLVSVHRKLISNLEGKVESSTLLAAFNCGPITKPKSEAVGVLYKLELLLVVST